MISGRPVWNKLSTRIGRLGKLYTYTSKWSLAYDRWQTYMADIMQRFPLSTNRISRHQFGAAPIPENMQSTHPGWANMTTKLANRLLPFRKCENEFVRVLFQQQLHLYRLFCLSNNLSLRFWCEKLKNLKVMNKGSELRCLLYCIVALQLPVS